MAVTKNDAYKFIDSIMKKPSTPTGTSAVLSMKPQSKPVSIKDPYANIQQNNKGVNYDKIQLAVAGQSPTQKDINRLYQKRDDLTKLQKNPYNDEQTVADYASQIYDINKQIERLAKVVPNAQLKMSGARAYTEPYAAGVQKNFTGPIYSALEGVANFGDKILEGNVISNILHDLYKADRAGQQITDKKLQEAQIGRGEGFKAYQTVAEGVGGAVPNAVLAIATGGTSAAAQLPEIAGSAGLTSTIRTGLTSIAKNPQFKLSFVQNYGSSYQNAKDSGATEDEAQLTAIITGLINAGVEVTGGIETLPAALRSGSASAIRQWVVSSLSEGKEGMVQNVIERLTQKMVYDQDKPLVSVTDPNAVFNPITSAKEGATGTAIGGLLGGGQVLTNNAISAAQNAKSQTPPTTPQNAPQATVGQGASQDAQTSKTAVRGNVAAQTAYVPTALDNVYTKIESMDFTTGKAENIPNKKVSYTDVGGNVRYLTVNQNDDGTYGAFIHKLDGNNYKLVKELYDQPSVESALKSLGFNTSALPEGMGAAEKGFTGTVERGFSRNVATDNAMQADIREDFQLAPEMYKQLGNKVTLAKAESIFSKGTDEALAYLNQKIGSGKLSPEDVPLSRKIANELAKQGNMDGARAIISDVAVQLTEAGQLTQAASILRNGDPVSVENTIQKALDKINVELAKRGSKFRAQLTPEELDLIRNSDFSQEGVFESVYAKIAQRIGGEMGSTMWEKLTEIRRMAMLLNPKTQIKNFAGNIPLAVMRKASERLAGGIQDILVKMGVMDKSAQTRTFLVGQESKSLAKQLFDLNKDVLVNGSDKWDMNTLIRQYRKYFGKSMAGKATDAVRTFTYNLLQKGDYPFLKSAFVDNAAQYIEAQGYKSIDEIPVGVAERATQQALEATFRDASMLARLLNQMKRNGGVGGAAIDILFPFTTTPINIAKRTYEYSPLGAIKVASDIITHKDASVIIDDFTKFLTGTAIVALGFYLKSLGVITGAADKDEDKRNFDKATGNSPYSFAGKVPYDWLQPAGSLLAMGAAAFDAANSKEGVVDKITSTVTASGDAYLNMTFFQSVIDLFKGYGSTTENVLTEILTSGASQFAPSVLGALSRTIDPTVRTSQTGGNVIQNTLAGAQQKSPLSYMMPPSVNVKGEVNQRVDNTALRAFQEFLNPAQVNTNKSNAVDYLISAVYKSTGNKGVFPKTAPDNIDGSKLTGEERAQFQTTLGKTTYDILQQELNSKSFNALSDDKKAAVIEEIIKFASDKAEREYAQSKGQTYSSSYDDEQGIKDLGTYFVYKQAYGDSSEEMHSARMALLSDTSIDSSQVGLLYDSLFSDSYYDKYEEYGKALKIPAKTFVALMHDQNTKAGMIEAAEKKGLNAKQINAILESKGWKPDYR